MNVFALNLYNYNPNDFYFLDPKNNLIMEGIFTKNYLHFKTFYNEWRLLLFSHTILLY